EKRTGTVVRLWPDPKYFDSPNIPLAELEHLVRSKAYLLPGLTMILEIEGKEKKTWKYERGMAQYFDFVLQGRELIAPLFTGERFFQDSNIPEIEPGEGASWAIGWVADGDTFADSHVNLIPTRSGGTHEAGFRAGIFEALAAVMDPRGLPGTRRSRGRNPPASPRCPASSSIALPAMSRGTNCSWWKAIRRAARRRRRATRRRRRCCRCAARC